MTSAERALALIVQKHDRYLDGPGCKRFAASLPNGGAYSLADLDDALWLSEVIDAAVAEALPRWVPVTERLPSDSGENVLVTTKEGWVTTDYYMPRSGPPSAEYFRNFDVVAWQPLPAPWVAP